MRMERKNIYNVLPCVLSRIVLLMFVVIVIYLTAMSLFSTSYIEVHNSGTVEEELWEETAFFIKDHALFHILIFLLVVAGICMIRRKIARRYYKKTQYLMLGIFFIAGLAMLLVTLQYPKGDQGKVMKIAEEILAGNFEQFAVGGYMHRYPDQTGIVLVLTGIIWIFGEQGYLVIQFINLILLTGIIWLMKCIGEKLFFIKHRNIGLYTILAFLCFLPIYPYVTFIYGTLPGLFFSILAIYLEFCYFERRQLAAAFISSFCISVAIVLKTNSVIMAIAMVLFLIYDIIISEKKRNTILFLLLLVFSCITMGHISNHIMEQLTGIPVSEGMPKTAWIAMGLQDGYMAPGWWNGYSVSLYEECGYDYELTDEKARKNIVDTLTDFHHNKKDGLNRIGRKMASQWNNPTFQCFSVNEGRESDYGVFAWIDSMVLEKIRNLLTDYMNVFQSILLFGVLCYTIYAWKCVKMQELLLAVVVIGGFLFHVFWEAKCQYILPYFLLMFPYAVCGYQELSVLADTNWKKVFQGRDRKFVMKMISIIVVSLALFVCTKTTVFKLTIGISDSPERLKEYEAIVEDR